jgi:glycosyltransferase involved in cell wall biosynthesis
MNINGGNIPAVAGDKIPSVLIVAHGHPHLAPGGGEIVAHELYLELRRCPRVEAHYLGAMIPQFGTPHCGSALMPANDDPRQTLYWSDRYNYFLMAQDNLALMIEEFGRYLQHVRPDVVHFHHVHNLGVEAIRIVRNVCPKARILVTLHEFLPICYHDGQMVKTKSHQLCDKASPADCHRCFPNIQSGDFFLRERFIKSHFELVDLFLCPSRFLLRRYVDWGIPESKIRYVENGHIAANTATKATPPPGRNAFAYFGQISPYKGLPVLLDAAHNLLKRGWRDFRVDIYGSMQFLDSERQDAIRQKCEAADSHVRFHGGYRPEDVVRLMSSADWLVVPSIWWENSPLVIQEAFAARRPVICSAIGGMAEKVRHEGDGLHFRVGDPVDLADTMMRAGTEPGLHQRLAEGIGPVRAMRASACEHLHFYGIKTGAAESVRESVPGNSLKNAPAPSVERAMRSASRKSRRRGRGRPSQTAASIG